MNRGRFKRSGNASGKFYFFNAGLGIKAGCAYVPVQIKASQPGGSGLKNLQPRLISDGLVYVFQMRPY
jgi:hypothetical protein